jgi:serine/threonine protein phosphatase PrpC
MGFETVARTHVGCRRRVNEDAVLARPDLGLWAVADGMGGHQAGDVASALVVEALAGARAGRELEARTTDVRERLEAANARLISIANSGPEPVTIGSTVVALVVEQGRYSCLWAGDSRIYRARGGKLVQLTRDHSLVQELVDLGEIDPADAQSHPNANVITRAVGADPALEVDVAIGEIEADDVFLLASDGLTRLVAGEELLQELQAEPLEPAADRLLQACLERGAPDNVSFVILRIRPD